MDGAAAGDAKTRGREDADARTTNAKR
jgi:hypothetical protein